MINEAMATNVAGGILVVLVAWLFNRSISLKLDELTSGLKELSNSIGKIALESKTSAVLIEGMSTEVFSLRKRQHDLENMMTIVKSRQDMCKHCNTNLSRLP